MSNNSGNLAVKIESGQILSPDTFPMPNELVCIHVPKVMDQKSLRDCSTRNIILNLSQDICNPKFTFYKATDFIINEVKILSSTELHMKSGHKKLILSVKLKYNIYYSDGQNDLIQPDYVVFYLKISDIYCPDCSSRIGAIHYPDDMYPANVFLDSNGMFLKVEAVVETLNDTISSCTGALILQIGAFFVVKCCSNVPLLLPSYGYCPIPAEQSNIAENCITFKNPDKTPFPSNFFPDQKWNPLNNAKG